MSFLRRHWVQLVILATPFVVLAVLWPSIPEQVPIHWNLHGEADGFAGKAMGVFLLPGLNVGLVLLLGWLIRFDPRLRKASPDARRSTGQSYELVILLISGFLSYLSILMLLTAAGRPVDIAFACSLGVLAMLLVIGNLLGKVAPNYLLGIRTPWTLESPVVWRKTHRWGGRVMMGGALLGMVLLFLLPGPYFLLGYFLPYLLVLALGSMAYSWWLYRRERAA